MFVMMCMHTGRGECGVVSRNGDGTGRIQSKTCWFFIGSGRNSMCERNFVLQSDARANTLYSWNDKEFFVTSAKSKRNNIDQTCRGVDVFASALKVTSQEEVVSQSACAHFAAACTA